MTLYSVEKSMKLFAIRLFVGRIVATSFALLVSVAAVASAQQTLILENGDRLSGRLTKIEGDQWVFAHAGGEVKIPVASVAQFTAADAIGVRLTDGTILAATLSGGGNTLQLAAIDGSTRTVAMSDVAAVGDASDLAALEQIDIGYFSPFGMFWGATASLGFSDKSGNSRSRGLSLAFEAGRRSPKDRLTFKAGLAREEARLAGDELETTVEKYFGSLRLDVFVSPKFFVFGLTGQERDQFQDIDLRSTYNAGFGYQIIANDLTDLRWYASGGARVENFTSGGSESTTIAATGVGLRQVLGPAVFSWNGDWSPSVENFRDYRFVSDASLTTTIYKGLGFRIGLRNELNNNPRPGVRKHDMLVTTTLTYTIGQ
jgi:putative salt-induced outer membrane protein YdiY